MAEILTESFCERCGTRYTFEASAPRRSRVGRLKLISKGLRNYVLSDESTLEEALDEARGEEERLLSTQQLEAFHQTFNFCMSCRQYTCGNCWNEADARCLSCAPDLNQEVLPTAFPDLPIVPTFEPAAGSAWPSSDLPAELAVVADSAPGSPSTEEIEAEPDDRLAARLAALGAVAAVQPEAPAVDMPKVTPAPERSLEEDEAEIAAMLAAAEAARTAAAETPPVAERPAADVVAQPPVAPEPAMAKPTPVPVEPQERLPAAATLADRSGWSMVAPETPLVAEDRVAAAQPSGNGHQPEPAWPTQSGPPQWPTPQARPAPVAAGRVPGHGTNALWVASSRDVVSMPGSGIAACVSCGLPLSANARFCRRCGSRQLN